MVERWVKLGLAAAAACVALCTGSEARAEYPAPAPYIGLFGGGNVQARHWDLGSNTREASKRPDGASGMVGLRLGLQVFKPLAIEAEGGWVPVKGLNGGSNNAMSYSLNAYYQILSGDWTPYIGAGIGVFQNTSSGLGKDWDQRTHVALGLRGLFHPQFALRVEARDVFTDGFDKWGGNLVEAHVGLDMFFSRAQAPQQDRDRDGITDDQDKCPDVAGPKETQGCPDRDKDGIVDDKDQCPDVAGKPELQGCPDSDGDGIVDAQDKCPTVAGIKELEGCPDKDKDGVTDAADKCPDVPGKPEFAGCPDTDGDGLADAEDKCPQLAGPKETGGCPDRDRDGVMDPDDKCPDQPGLKEAQGCIPEAAKKFTGAIKGINFETGSAKIMKNSFKLLDEAVEMLKKFEGLRLRIEGHTDNQGKPDMNQKLSQDRAESVRSYMVSKGVGADRLESAGYGDTKPAKPNDTPQGRAANRRIEFVPLGAK
jgi:outer membrane protein OmpA-like peptidoglycan-associated protein